MKLLILFCVGVLPVSVAWSGDYYPSKQSKENYSLKVTLSEDHRSSKFELCDRSGRYCQRLGLKEFYSHQELHRLRHSFEVKGTLTAAAGTAGLLFSTLMSGVPPLMVASVVFGAKNIHSGLKTLGKADKLQESFILDEDAEVTVSIYELAGFLNSVLR